MKIERTKNAVRNIIFGFILKVTAIIFPFIIRTVILYYLGTEYAGLNSLFTSILSFLSLAELGVGSAIVYSMYKPIAEDDDTTICALLNLYKHLYCWIGVIIAVVGLGLTPFLKYLVKDGCPPDVDLYILYFIYLFNTVISYFMFAYKQSLLMAFQRTDLISKRSMVVQLLMYAVQIVLLLTLKNYYAYIICLPIFTIVTNIANAIIVDKMFPQYKCKGDISKEQKKEITKKITALFGSKANSIVMHAADNIVISSFLGLVIVGQYGNYYYIMNAIIGIMTVIYESLTAGIGNGLETDSKDKNYDVFKMLSFLNAFIVNTCSVCLLCLYEPFIKLWAHEENMLGMGIVVLLTVYFYLYQIRRIVLTYKDAAGIWWEDRFRPYVMMIVNIVLNIVLVQVIGLYGVILSTIVSMVISLPWENFTIFKYVFTRSSAAYYWMSFKYVISTFVISVIMYVICGFLPEGFFGLIIKGILCFAVSGGLFILFNIKSSEFKASKAFIIGYFSKRRKVK